MHNADRSLVIVLVVVIIVAFALIFAFTFVFIKKQDLQKQGVTTNKKRHFLFKKRKSFDIDIVKNFAINLTNALAKLAEDRVGGLIVIENKDNLEHYAGTGNRIDSPFYSEFIYSIFYNHSSALHDGAIIVKNWRIKALSAYLPISKKMLDVKYGARHRAAFGITEATDAIAFVVSETYGTILCIFNNTIHKLDSKPSILVDQILEILFKSHQSLIGQEIPKIEKF